MKKISKNMKNKKLIGLFIALNASFTFYIFFLRFSSESDQLANINLSKGYKSQETDRLCQRCCQNWDPDLPIIYLITPTYTRAVQKAELTRLSQTLMLVRNLHWILIEDSLNKTLLVERLLSRSLLNYTHLNVPTRLFYKKEGVAKGMLQRNAGLAWLRKNRSYNDIGVIYFADDDNTYDIQLFTEMRFTKEVSIWPVGLVGGSMVEKPIVNMNTGKVIGFKSGWIGSRNFPTDMAGFAVNLGYFLTKNVSFSRNNPNGHHETILLQQLNVTMDRLEPKADNCTRVLVWHTKTQGPNLNLKPQVFYPKRYESDFAIEV